MGIRTTDADAAARVFEANGGGVVKGSYDDAHERRVVLYDYTGNGLAFYRPLARSVCPKQRRNGGVAPTTVPKGNKCRGLR